MKVVVNNIELHKMKTIMDSLIVCAKDKNISASERATYYAEYIELSATYLKLLSSK